MLRLFRIIVFILNKLELSALGDAGTTGLGNLGTFIGPDGLFQITQMIPPYYLQIAIGIYLIQIIFILTRTLVTVDSGEDKLERTNKIGKNLARGIILYFITALLATLALFVLSSVVLGNL